MIQLMRLAWFSPLPPVRSGIATVNAALLDRLDGELAIDCFVDRRAYPLMRLPRERRVFDAHDFVWKMRRAPYDLVMTVELNHTIVWCRDQHRSAAFLTEILGRPPAVRFGPFLVVEVDNGISLDFHETDGEIEMTEMIDATYSIHMPQR